MKFASLDRFGTSPWKLVAVGVGASAVTWLLVGFVTGEALGQAKNATLFVVATLVFYVVISTPRRLADRQRVAQARESLLLSAAATACLRVTGSRSKTLMLLKPRDPALAITVSEAGRRVLLGMRVDDAVASSSQSLASYSAAAALRGLARMQPKEFNAGDEETRGLATTSEVSRETKLPIFMTVCFFSPIMLTLYAVFSHTYDPGRLAELAAFEFVALDLAFYFTASDPVTH